MSGSCTDRKQLKYFGLGLPFAWHEKSYDICTSAFIIFHFPSSIAVPSVNCEGLNMKISSFLLVLTSFYWRLYLHIYHYSNCI